MHSYCQSFSLNISMSTKRCDGERIKEFCDEFYKINWIEDADCFENFNRNALFKVILLKNWDVDENLFVVRY